MKTKRKRNPKPASSPRGDYILGMDKPDGSFFVLPWPTRYATHTEAYGAAREKHAKYGRVFTVLKVVARTTLDPKDIQLEIFR